MHIDRKTELVIMRFKMLFLTGLIAAFIILLLKA